VTSTTTRTDRTIAELPKLFERARWVLQNNGWVAPAVLSSLEARIAERPSVTPLAGRSILAQYLIDLHLLSREQANELDTILLAQLTMPEFRLLRKIGSGGMGTVFLAEYLATGQQVALKTINAKLAGEDDFVSRFHREANALQKIDHPSVAKTIATGDGEGHCWLAMDYIDGPSLMHVLREHRILPEAYALSLTRQLAGGLGHVWKTANLVHRDLKPENILVIRTKASAEHGPNDNPFPLTDIAKLIDFGLVKSNTEDDRLTQTGMTIGTPLYMSPEQVRGEKLDCRSDIYGLGATLYHLLTGSTPFTGSSPGAIMSAHLTQPVPDPGDKVPTISEQTRQIIRMCMGKQAKDRYTTFEALEQACAESLEDLIKRGSSGERLLRKPMAVNKTTRRSGEVRLNPDEQRKLQAAPEASGIKATRISGEIALAKEEQRRLGIDSDSQASDDIQSHLPPPIPTPIPGMSGKPDGMNRPEQAGRPGTRTLPGRSGPLANQPPRRGTAELAPSSDSPVPGESRPTPQGTTRKGDVAPPVLRVLTRRIPTPDINESKAFSDVPHTVGVGVLPWVVLVVSGAAVAVYAFLF
jgi:serine/threonine protein kinase